jgi:hypothetical protein
MSEVEGAVLTLTRKNKNLYCSHNRVYNICTQCVGGGKRLCLLHRREKCTECGGPGICEHKSRRYRCRICIDNKMRTAAHAPPHTPGPRDDTHALAPWAEPSDQDPLSELSDQQPSNMPRIEHEGEIFNAEIQTYNSGLQPAAEKNAQTETLGSWSKTTDDTLPPCSEQTGQQPSKLPRIQYEEESLIAESHTTKLGSQASAGTDAAASSSRELPVHRLRSHAKDEPQKRYTPAPAVMYFEDGDMGFLSLQPMPRTEGEALLGHVVTSLTVVEPKSIPCTTHLPECMERVTNGKDGRLICNYHTHDEHGELPYIRAVRKFLEWCMHYTALPVMLKPLSQGSGVVELANFECIVPTAASKKGIKEQSKHRDRFQKNDMVCVVFSTTGVPLKTLLREGPKGKKYVQATSSVFAFDLAWWHAGPAEEVPEGTDFSNGKMYIGQTRFMTSFVRSDMTKADMDEMLEHDGGAADKPMLFAVPF